MKKRIFALVAFGLCLIPVFFLIFSHYFQYHDGLIYTLNEDGDSYSVVKGRSSLVHADIPPTHKNKPVTALRGNAFSSCDDLVSISVPPSVQKIEGRAFIGCKKFKSIYISDLSAWCTVEITSWLSTPREQPLELYLHNELVTDLTIPEGVTKIGDFTFANMPNICNVKFPQGLVSIGEFAFSNCSSIPRFDLPESVSSLGMNAFSSCVSITEFTLPAQINTVPEDLLGGCSQLTTVWLHESVTSIERGAFYGCEALTSIQLPAELSSIGELAFYFCTSLPDLTLPKGLQHIGKEAFRDCYRFEHVSLPTGITTLERGVFEGCQNLKTVHLPEGLTEIHHYAFSDCYRLQDISLPSGLDFLGANAFELKNLPLTVYENGLYLGNSENPYLVLMKMQDTTATQFIFAPSAKFIHSNAFENAALESLTVPHNIKFICRNAFNNCQKLKTVTFSAGVSCIEEGIFDRCGNLEEVHFSDPHNWWGYSHYYDMEKEAIPSEELADPKKNVKKLEFFEMHQYYKKIQP